MRFSVMITCQGRLAQLQLPLRAQAERAIQSVLEQIGDTPVEIIFSSREKLSGLYDHIEQVFRDTIAEKRLRLLPQTQTEPRNAAAGIAQGNVLAFLDAQDWWRPGHLARLDELFHRHDLIFEVQEHPGQSSDWFRTFLSGLSPVPSSLAVRRSLFDSVGGFADGRRIPGALEYDFVLKCLINLQEQGRKDRAEILPPGLTVHEPSFWEGGRVARKIQEARQVISKIQMARRLPRAYIPLISPRKRKDLDR